MKEILFENIDVPTATLKKNCDSIYRKNIAIIQTLKNVVVLAEDSKQLDEHQKIYLASECGNYLEKLYQIMNYSGLVLGEVFGSRGQTFKTNFHQVAVCVLKKDKGYQNIALTGFIESVIPWYPIVHDMRSEEAHFSMGNIIQDKRNYIFCLNRESPRNSFYDTLKQLEKISNDRVVNYNLSIIQLKEILIGYTTTMRHLENIVKTYTLSNQEL